MTRALSGPLIAACLALVATYLWGGIGAMFTTLLLIVLEVTLSFDNAVVNAAVLRRMTPQWQERFITWGIPISVIFTRALLPVLIVAAAIGASPVFVAHLAVVDPAQYGILLAQAHTAIASFGGMFLLLVALSYFIDDKKNTHWLHSIEKFLARWGEMYALEIAIALVLLLLCAWAVAPGDRTTVLAAGVIGIAIFILVRSISSIFEVETEMSPSGVRHERAALALFIYLNILDAAFSLDSVVGAFVLTAALPVIVIGLGVGAYAVRSLTLTMVHHRVLDTLAYIEHGAHWAILWLAVAMLAGLFMYVPEPVTGFVGLFFVGLAYRSSLIEIERKISAGAKG